MENTPQNQERFLHQYHGQRVLYINSFHENPLPVADEYVRHIYSENNNVIAELTSLHKISDEDAIEVVKIFSRYTGRIEVVERITGGVILVKCWTSQKVLIRFKDLQYYLNENGSYHLYSTQRNSHVVDFLRSRGYALPWMGISVETMVEWEWIQLKNN